MIPFAHRFHGHNSLRFVYKNGKVVRSRHATLKSTTNPHRSLSRIAVVISKKVLKSAVRRNRIRRRIYEYVRQQIPRMNQVYDIVFIITSSELLTMPSDELTTQIEQLMDQSGLFKTP
jgi:ribonuclease P protein component